ncbi:MAG: argininosuccinate lyase [Planctomycetota bacterium]
MSAARKPRRAAKRAGAKSRGAAAASTQGLLRGRFAGGVHPALDGINRSFEVDRRLWAEDIVGSVAHARMLGAQGILPAAAVKRIIAGLRRVAKEFDSGTFRPAPGDEDIHMAVERRLIELIGEDGKRLHTARSRNDQVATDLRLHLMESAAVLQGGVRAVQSALLVLARRDGEAILPFYTHMQRAQPVLLGHVLLAYVEMLEQDRRGLFYEALECPLGAGAGAGTTFPIDRQFTARGLGFQAPSPNSLEAVSSRRDATMFLASMAACAVTLSRLGADLVLWTSREFGFARLGDAVSTGSSIMPQKRNADGAELLRAKALRVSGALARLLELQRGLPLGYHKDLQEDKPALFEAEDTLGEMLAVAAAMLGDLRFDAARMRAAVDEPSGYLLATEAADWLVRQGISFREAHEAVGRLVREAESRGMALEALPLETFRAAHKAFNAGIFKALTPEAAVSARRAIGGTAPKNVAREIARWGRVLRA